MNDDDEVLNFAEFITGLPMVDNETDGHHYFIKTLSMWNHELEKKCIYSCEKYGLIKNIEYLYQMTAEPTFDKSGIHVARVRFQLTEKGQAVRDLKNL